MSKSLGIRKLKLKKLPRGRFHYMVAINTAPPEGYSVKKNKEEVADITRLLEDNGVGRYRFTRPPKKTAYKNILCTLYLEDKTDLMLVKMCYAKYIYRIYEIILEK